jgi:hypothetical protein
VRKTIFLPTSINRTTLREEEHTLVGYTGDGHVGLTPAFFDLVGKIEITVAEATTLASELLSATYHAKKLADEAAGLNEWAAKPVGDSRYEVRFHGRVGIFRPIVNGKRRQRPGHRVRSGHTCTVCRKEAPEGATMYVLDESTWKPGTYDANVSELRHHRVCEGCMRPDMLAARLLAATQGGGG